LTGPDHPSRRSGRPDWFGSSHPPAPPGWLQWNTDIRTRTREAGGHGDTQGSDRCGPGVARLPLGLAKRRRLTRLIGLQLCDQTEHETSELGGRLAQLVRALA
jgi:hypothetical protein